MSKDNDRSVYKNENGKWADKRDSASRPASLHNTQKEAQESARERLANSGGGELKTMGRDGKIRSKDTIPPANDPHPPKDTEH